MRDEIEKYVRELGLDAYLVGGAVRDELLGLDSKDADFLVPGLDTEGLRAALAPHGRVEDLVVADRLVGIRLHPSDREIRKLTPAGIEFAPPRKEVSTGPGRHDFEIVADPKLSVEDDMRRRDFTVNAMARRLDTGELVDPLGGRADLEARRLRTVSPQSFREDPLRLVRALRFVSQLGFEPDDELLDQMREEAPAVKLVSGERIGGGLSADGMGELSKLLLGAEPARALRLARDTGVLVELLPEFGPAIGFDQESRYHDLTVDEHTFAVVQAAADKGFSLRRAARGALPRPRQADRRLARARRAPPLLREARLRRPRARPGRRRPRVGGAAPAPVSERAPEARRPDRAPPHVPAGKGRRPPGAALPASQRRRARVRPHRPQAGRPARQARQRRRAAAASRRSSGSPRFREVVEQELSSPHRLRDLAIDGNDLIELGFRPGPQLGHILHDLLDAVVDEPALNTRDELLARAKERL